MKSRARKFRPCPAEKKAAYAEYRKARENMKELLTAKANIDRILKLEEDREGESIFTFVLIWNIILVRKEVKP